MAADPPVDLTLLSDRALVRLFAQTGSDEAFRQLVDRHAALVLGTCRRGLHSAADSDDAFQATFLVLARSARKIRRADALAAWLYGVATRICLRMRRDAARRNTQQLMDTPSETVDPLDELLARHDEMVADEELNRLPASLRTPMVLRYLAGKSNGEVAEELGITVAALEGRLKRGKQQLRLRLLRRGVTLAAVVATFKATRVVAGEVPAGLIDSATELAISNSAATISSLARESTTTTHFALQELSAMNAAILSKPIVAALVMGGMVGVVLSAQVALSQGDPGTSGATVVLNATAQGHASADASDATTIDPVHQRPTANDAASDPAASNANPFEPSRQSSPQPTADAPRIPGIVDLKPRSKSELAIEMALTKPLSSLGLEFQGAPLAEVVDFLRTEYDVEVQIDHRALDEMGLSPDEPVDVNLRNISLESALNIMLGRLDMTFIVDNEVLLITSDEVALTRLETRVYPTPKFAGLNHNSLTDLLTGVIAPDTWVERGGEGTFALVGDKLVIRQTYDVHRQINDLLAQLQRESDEGLSSKAIRNTELSTAPEPTDHESTQERDDPFGF